MNILYSGDKNIMDGLIISILSLMKNTSKDLNIYILTMSYKDYPGLENNDILSLEKILKKKRDNINLKLIDITDIVNKELPTANINTHFTPGCMLRLYADQVDLPDKILYLDNDVVCLRDFSNFYDLDISSYELAGVLDYYGSHFFKKKLYRKDYLNSGVLLLNLKKIRETNLFGKCRKRCQKIKMVMPDQTAINVLAKRKLIVDTIYNDQHEITDKTVFRHYTTTFKFWPTVHTQTVKPWHIDKLHDILNDHEFDDILDEYLEIKGEIYDTNICNN